MSTDDAPSPLTHFNAAGEAHMVDVGAKSETHRIAVASGRIRMQAKTPVFRPHRIVGYSPIGWPEKRCSYCPTGSRGNPGTLP